MHSAVTEAITTPDLLPTVRKQRRVYEPERKATHIMCFPQFQVPLSAFSGKKREHNPGHYV